MAAINDLPAFGGLPSNAKIILLGSLDFHSENLMNWVRSLHIEHVSPAGLSRREISRRPGSAEATEASTIALLRKWFFARKPDAGFLLTNFPATLLQAIVFAEWLDARDETLVAVFAAPDVSTSVSEHYRTLGLLVHEKAVLSA
jgi:adenylate kinase